MEDANLLDQQLGGWLAECGIQGTSRARAIIAPHAGFRYSGRCAAYAFAQIDPKVVKRVFLLGPSHHHFTRKCALSPAKTYESPLGNVPVDQEVYAELRATGQFEEMTSSVDEAEHSLEMHLPYLMKVLEGCTFSLVPIMVGALLPEAEARYGSLLAKYMDDPTNFFSISSDFCHWGTRFSYTYYEKKHGPIYKSIEVLDRSGMELIEAGDPEAFTEYLSQYENTICGRHPIGVLLQILKSSSTNCNIKFVQYEQSSKCQTMAHSSVSYASAVALVLE